MLACLYIQSSIGVGLYFVQDFWVFAGLRCAQGVFIQVTHHQIFQHYLLSFLSLGSCLCDLQYCRGADLSSLAFCSHFSGQELLVSGFVISQLERFSYHPVQG